MHIYINDNLVIVYSGIIQRYPELIRIKMEIYYDDSLSNWNQLVAFDIKTKMHARYLYVSFFSVTKFWRMFYLLQAAITVVDLV